MRLKSGTSSSWEPSTPRPWKPVPDAKEQQHTMIMGCYGIGVNRIIAALVETRHDDNGIIWPMSFAPYRSDPVAAERDAEPT